MIELINALIAIPAFLINIFHFAVLLQKGLRENPVFLLMLAITMCHLIILLSLLIDKMFYISWPFTRNICNDAPYYQLVISNLTGYLLITMRRSASYLALLLSLIRTLSVMFPLSPILITFSQKKSIILMCFGIIVVCSIYDGMVYSTMRLEKDMSEYA